MDFEAGALPCGLPSPIVWLDRDGNCTFASGFTVIGRVLRAVFTELTSVPPMTISGCTVSLSVSSDCLAGAVECSLAKRF